MPSYGQPLGIQYPENGDAWVTYTSKILAALTTLAGVLQTKVTPTGFSWTSTLDAAGSAAQNLGYLNLLQQSALTTVPGSVINVDGDLYWVNDTATGVQITEGGVLAAASLGGIGGDYGGANPARVAFVDADGEYTFTQDPGVYASLFASQLRLKGNTNNCLIKSIAAGALQTWTLPAALPASKSLVTVDAAGNVTVDNALTTAITTSANITFTGAGTLKYPDHTENIPLSAVILQTNCTQTGVTSSKWVLNNPGDLVLPITVPVGDRLKSVTMRILWTAGTITPSIMREDQEGVRTTISTATTVTGGGLQNKTVVVTTPAAANFGETYWLRLTSNAASNELRSAYKTKDRP